MAVPRARLPDLQVDRGTQNWVQLLRSWRKYSLPSDGSSRWELLKTEYSLGWRLLRVRTMATSSFRTDHLRRLPSTCAPSVASALFKLATWMNWDLLSASKAQASGSRKLADFTDTVIANDEQLRFLAERFAESTPKLHQFLEFVHRLHAVSTEKLADVGAVDSQCAMWLRRRLAFEQAMRGMSQAIRDVVGSRDSVDYEDLRWFAERAGQLMAEVTA